MKKRIRKIVAASLAMMLVTINVCNVSALELSEKQEKIKQEQLEGVVHKEGEVKEQLEKTRKKSIDTKKLQREDIYNPNSYRLVNKGEKIDTLYDSYGTRHDLYFRGLNDYDSYWMNLELRDITDRAYLKDEIVSVDLYTDQGGHLDYAGYVDWNTLGMTEANMYSTVEKHLYEDQKYLYMIIGVSEYTSHVYSDYTLLKVKNPFAKDYVGHWAESAIVDFMEKGIIGTTNQFRPNDSITRAEFVKILNGVFGLTKSSGKVFEDTKNHWAKYPIDVAVTNGVCNGKTSTLFKPNDPITREEASVMIASYKKVTDRNYDKLRTFKDAHKVAEWSKPGVEGTIENGYMGGYSDSTFRPKNQITRAEAVATFSRIK